MLNSEIKQLLETKILNSHIVVEGEGCDFRIVVISDVFDGLTVVKRQQFVYSYLQPLIADGTIHAVSMTLRTRSEYQEKQ